MREIIAAFESLGHTVLPVINGGVGLNGEIAAKNKSMRGKYAARKIIPSIIWESTKDYFLVRQDKSYESFLQRHIDSFKPDIIYERANYLQMSGLHAAKKNNVSHLLEVNSPLVEERELLSGRSAFRHKALHAEKMQLNTTDKVIVVSTALRDYYKNIHGIPYEKFFVSPNAINPGNMTLDQEKIKRLKRELTIENKITIGFVGSFFKWHGLDVLIRAFAKLSQKYANLRLLLVGDGEHRNSLREIAVQEKMEKKILFVGNVPHTEIFNYIELMDITVLVNSHWYGSPVKLFEYGAMGKPVIAPDNVPVRDVFVDGKEVILVQPTVEDCMKKIRMLVDNTDLRKKLARNIKMKVLERYTWSSQAQKILRCLQ